MAAELVLFGIRTALRLGEEARRAYVGTTLRRELTLPLPKVEVTGITALGWFANEGKAYVKADAQLKALVENALAVTGAEREIRAKALLPHYQECWNAKQAELGHSVQLGQSSLDAEEWLRLFEIRQLSRSDDAKARKKLLTRVIGTVIEVGVDYFQSVPGALPKGGSKERVLGAVLTALDKVDVASLADDSDDFLAALAGRFVVAALETIGESPELVSRDDRVQELVQVTAQKLAEDVVKKRREGVFAELEAVDWAELVLRGVLNSAGKKVLENPDRYLGIENDGRKALVSKVGSSVLTLLISEDGIAVSAVISRHGLETVLSSALDVVAEHPDVFGKVRHKGLEALLADVASDLAAREELVSPEVFPALVSSILGRSSEHLELIWPGGAKDPKKHLLLVAAKKTLDILASPPEPDGNWKLTFSSADLLDVVDAVLDDLAAHPAWLLEGAESIDANLAAALGATLEVIRQRGDAKLISRSVAVTMLKASLRAVAIRQELASLPQDGKPLIAAALDAVLETILGQSSVTVKWQLFRDEALVTAVQLSLTYLGGAVLTEDSVAQLRQAVEDLTEDLEAGYPLDWQAFGDTLETALETETEE